VTATWLGRRVSRRDQRLDRTAASRTTTLASALGGYENALRAARSLWLASDHVGRMDFAPFARSLDKETRYPGLQNIGWREIVRDRDAARFVATARAEGVTDFTIRPPGRRAVYYLTRYSYPPGSRLGLDARVTPASSPAWTAPATPGRPPSAAGSRSTTTPGPRPAARSPTS
jgi:CHASE1-domain containing sensor protein